MDTVPPAQEPVEADLDSEPTARDAVADGIEYELDPNSVSADRLTGLIWLVSIAVPLLIVFILVALFASLPPIVPPLLFVVWVVQVSFFAFYASWWPAVHHRHVRYRTDANGFMIRSGVVWRAETSIPKARVQHIDVVQGPIHGRFGLAELVIHTAGTQDASVSLGGLPHATALAIRDFLINDDLHD